MHELLPACIELAKQAGQAILDVVRSRELGAHQKHDDTFVTLADLNANTLICAGLAKLTPAIPIISEEIPASSFLERSAFKKCWLVDPLDGTKGFIAGSQEYTVNIALIENQQPILGVIYAPARHRLYYAVKNQGAFLHTENTVQSLQTARFNHHRSLIIAVSHYHHSTWLSQLLATISDYQLIRLNSSIKMGIIAEGIADFYPRLGPTSEWDTAAGQIVLEEAGGLLMDLEGKALRYIARDTLINPGFLAIGDQREKDYFLELMYRCRRYSDHSQSKNKF